jgi:transcriptional regulator with XRE-family HTH domain
VPPDPDRVLSEFIDAWNAGRRPDVDEHLARVEPAQRDELAGDIAAFVAFAPTPDYDDAALAAIRAEPAVAAAAAAVHRSTGLWPALLPRLRERAALTTAQLASALVGALGLPAAREPKTQGYLERLEAGDLEPRGLSGRLLDALARVLAVPRDDLEAAGAFGAPAAAPALFRAEGPAAEAVREDLDVLADALAAPAGGDWDEVDELFRGGGAA